MENFDENSGLRLNCYYQFVGEATDDSNDWQPGELVLLADVDGSQVRFAHLESTWTMDIDEFTANFTYDPEGDRKRMEEMGRLLVELQAGQDESAHLEHLAIAAGDDEEALPGSHSTALIPIGDRNKVQRMKTGLAHVRQATIKHSEQLARKMNAISGLMKERQAALEIWQKRMNKLVQRAEEFIWTINLYLGKDEQIVQLQQGEPAPADTPITVRQQVLWMAEECAIASESGGIESWGRERFDKWLVESPVHLDQILPEPRGIVALKPTRTERPSSGDFWVDDARKKANTHTYFLMRNGDNLYRIDTDLEVYDVLFPRRTEFDDLFVQVTSDYRRRGHRLERVATEEQILPGSKAYNDAMDRASARERHYMRILIFIQGLLDRTEIFQPMPLPPGYQINVMDQKSNREYMRYVYDAEMLLGTGRLDFYGWLEEINSRLEVGHRIIGEFGTFGARGGGFTAKDRIRPTNARYPVSLEIYTLERREKEAFIFLYERKEEIYVTEGWTWTGEKRQPKVRASCKVFKADPFILAIDEADRESMEYYLANRTDRHAYVHSFPLLKKAIAIKEQEAKQERPFRRLLVGQVMKQYNADLETVEAGIDELIRWYKFKNKTHRALLKDDRLALTAIVTEWGHREKREVERRGAMDLHRQVATAIVVDNPAVIYVGHKKENLYVALVPHNDENKFVVEEEWRRTRTGITRSEKREWRTIDKRRERWLDLYVTERYKGWEFDIRGNQFITDAEFPRVIEQSLESAKKRAANQIKNSDRGGGKKIYLPFVVTLNENQMVEAYYTWNLGFVDHKHPLTRSSVKPEVCSVELSWKRDVKGVLVLTEDDDHTWSYTPKEKLWEGERSYRGGGKRKILWIDEENIHKLDDMFEQIARRSKVASNMRDVADRVMKQVEEWLAEQKERELYARFMADLADVALWAGYKEEHKKELEIDHPQEVKDAAKFLVEAGVKMRGMTLRQMFDEAGKYGWKLLTKSDRRYNWGYEEEMAKKKQARWDAHVLPMDLVIDVDETVESVTELTEDDYD